MLDENYKINASNALTMQKSPDEDTTYYTMVNKRYVAQDPFYIARENVKFLNKNYPNKALAVHCDIDAKTAYANVLGFKGYEVNIDLEKFKVGHPPEYTLDFEISDYLASFDKQKDKKIWFDIKSPKGKSIAYSLAKFNELDAKFDLKSRSLIESYEEGLLEFVQNGWQTSFYLHHSIFPKGCKFDEECAKTLKPRIEKSGASGISFSYSDYAFVKKFLEPILDKKFDYHMFGFPADFQISHPKARENYTNSRVLNDTLVKTILLEPGTTGGGNFAIEFRKFE